MKKIFTALLALALSAGQALAQTDVTSKYIKNADLADLTGWTVVNKEGTGVGSSANDAHIVEFYAGWGSLTTTSYSMTQSVTLPAGKYRLINNAFFRQGLTYNVDATKSLAYLKAGDNQTLLKTLGSVSPVPTATGGVANDKPTAANQFGQDMYQNELDFELTEEKTIEIGITGTFDLKQSWCITGPFQLLDMNQTAVTDVTYLITNPGFEYKDMTGWTLEGTSKFAAQGGNTAFDNMAGKYYAEKWQASGALADGKMSQTLTGLTNGIYRLSAYIYHGGTGAYLQANDDKTEVAAASSGKYTVTTIVTDGNLTIEAGLSGATANWVCFDRFQLELMPDVIDDATAAAIIGSYDDIKDEPMYGETKTALDNAKTAFEANKTTAYYIALTDAITAAKTSIAAYKTGKTSLDNRYDLITTKTNFYIKDGSFYDDLLTKYNNRTLTDAEAKAIKDPYVVTDWHADSQLNTFFGKAWGVSDYTATPYVNTWSKEGISDGSDFKVPFYEYWVPDGQSLANAVKSGTIGGLTPNGAYTIKAAVRVRCNDDGGTPSGITMQVGDGTPVAITGTEIAQREKYFLDTYTAQGWADKDGNLTLKFNIEDTNVSWLSFQHVWYAEAPGYTLTVSSAGAATLCLPYETTIPEGVSVYTIESTSTVNGYCLANCTPVSDKLSANTPVYVTANEGRYFFAAESTEKVEGTPVKGLLTGVYEKTTVPTGSYLLLQQSGKVAFFKANSDGTNTVAANRAYLTKATTPDGSEAKAIYLNLPDAPTGISSIEAAETVTDGAIYNLAGQRVSSSAKGLLIKNGKKYIVK